MILALIPWCCFAVSLAAAVVTGVRLSRLKKQTHTERLISEAVCEDENIAYIFLEYDSHIPIYISDSATALFGLERSCMDADITALSWCTDKDDTRKFMTSFNEWDGEAPLLHEFEFKNLRTKSEGFGLAEITSHDGKFLSVKISEISREVHKRNELKKEIEQVRSEEQQKTNFLSTMSHEIRTPMNGILGMLTLARNNINEPQELLTCLDKAHGLSQFLLSIINDILDMSKIESGKVVLENVKFDLLECYNRLSEMFRTTAEQKGIKFTMKREDMDVRYVMGDSLRLMQVLTNLVSNANKYTPSGHEITITFRQMNKLDSTVHMQFRVKDTGKGMDPQFLSRIFKPFEQESASTTRKYGGTGLGMAIADNLVRLMGGHIVVDTALGRGSEFSVYIPFEIAPGDQSMDVEAAGSGKRREISLKGMRMLMAEDNAINAEIAIELFKMEDAELEVAENGKIAVEKIASCPDGYYDIVFMDIQMPEMDGWEAAKTIRAMDREYAQTVPIFALSANAFVEDKRHSIEIGMNGHISKPIDFDELKRILADSLPWL